MTNKIIFGLKPGTSVGEALPAIPLSGASRISRLHSIAPLTASYKKALTMNHANKFATDEALFQAEIMPGLSESDKKLYDTYVLELENADAGAIDSIVEHLQQHPGVRYAQIDEMNSLYLNPNDPDLMRQWAVPVIRCRDAWDTATGSGMVVAVIDTGVDYTHPDISANMWADAAGRPGHNFSEGNDDPADYHGHGTHCAGTIAATANNGLLVAGIAYDARIMAVKIFPNAMDSVCANAIRYAADNGANVISNSWGPTNRRETNTAVEEAIEYAVEKGCVVVFAAGNSNDDVQYYSPANHPSVISVAATDHSDSRASFSNYGNRVTIAAPGVDILSLRRAAGTTSMSGTSMACPHVSALAALVLQRYPHYTPADVRQAIQSCADAIATDQPIGRRINAMAAVA